MKTFRKIIYALIVLVVFNSCKSIKTTPETAKRNLEKIDNRNYTLIANFANPLRMQQIVLTSEYNLRIRKDSAFAFLPYYGVAYSAPLNASEGGIKFAEPIVDYQIKPNPKNDGREISFKINTREYNYQINMTIFQNGSATFVINSHQRDAITFYGELKE